jgi:nicotinamidase-related amidase
LQTRPARSQDGSTCWFTRDTSALVLIDHQIGTLQLIKNIASDAALRNAVVLAKAAKTVGMRIVMTASMEERPHEIVEQIVAMARRGSGAPRQNRIHLSIPGAQS